MIMTGIPHLSMAESLTTSPADELPMLTEDAEALRTKRAELAERQAALRAQAEEVRHSLEAVEREIRQVEACRYRVNTSISEFTAITINGRRRAFASQVADYQGTHTEGTLRMLERDRVLERVRQATKDARASQQRIEKLERELAKIAKSEASYVYAFFEKFGIVDTLGPQRSRTERSLTDAELSRDHDLRVQADANAQLTTVDRQPPVKETLLPDEQPETIVEETALVSAKFGYAEGSTLRIYTVEIVFPSAPESRTFDQSVIIELSSDQMSQFAGWMELRNAPTQPNNYGGYQPMDLRNALLIDRAIDQEVKMPLKLEDGSYGLSREFLVQFAQCIVR